MVAGQASPFFDSDIRDGLDPASPLSAEADPFDSARLVMLLFQLGNCQHRGLPL